MEIQQKQPVENDTNTKQWKLKASCCENFLKGHKCDWILQYICLQTPGRFFSQIVAEDREWY